MWVFLKHKSGNNEVEHPIEEASRVLLPRVLDIERHADLLVVVEQAGSHIQGFCFARGELAEGFIDDAVSEFLLIGGDFLDVFGSEIALG